MNYMANNIIDSIDFGIVESDKPSEATIEQFVGKVIRVGLEGVEIRLKLNLKDMCKFYKKRFYKESKNSI